MKKNPENPNSLRCDMVPSFLHYNNFTEQCAASGQLFVFFIFPHGLVRVCEIELKLSCFFVACCFFLNQLFRKKKYEYYQRVKQMIQSVCKSYQPMAGGRGVLSNFFSIPGLWPSIYRSPPKKYRNIKHLNK